MKSPSETISAHINGQRIDVAPGETLLQAALRQDIAFPHRCRVGGCGTCRCRLAEGQVQALTEPAYLLSEAELKRGYILACQSVPRGDVSVEVVLAPAGQRVPGRIAAPPGEAPREPAGLWDYAKYFGFHAVGLASVVALLAGGGWITAGLLAIVSFYILGDAVSGNDLRTPRFGRTGLLTAQLWLALPLMALIVFSAVWGVSAGDPLQFGAWLTQWTGYDVVAARDATTLGHHVSAVILTGLMIGMIGTITAHELMHRTWDKVSLLVARWLLAFSLDTSFSIEHVYGHHRYVATPRDPATAPRGRNVYTHMAVSAVKGNASAWRIERDRLQRRQRPVWSIHNAVLRGHAMSLVLLALAWAVGGATGLLFFAACGLWGKALLEVVNYMEHYGIVRDPATPVQPRHSWNTNRRISSWTLFNLTRHSHHHAQGDVPYQDLRPMPDSPMMIGGYLTVMVLTLVPPLWHALMTPRLLAWDRDFADPGERGLARDANAASGIAALVRAADQSNRGQLEASSVSR